MFAYCGNNPISYCDPAGYLRSDIGPSTMMYGGGGRKRLPLPNDKYSKTKGIIYGQAIFEHAHESMGFGTYEKNGCGVIAVYNAMQLLGDAQPLGKIEDDLTIRGGLLMGGHLGILPWVIDNYFASHEVKCTTYRSYELMNQHIYEGAIIVFMVANNVDNIFKGAHYMAAQYIGGQYVVYNAGQNDVEPYYAQTLEPVYGNSGWIVGFILEG